MRVLGIIAEYNPLHNGHIYQLNQAKLEIKPDYCIAIMSGNFTQRGEPALLSKWERTSLALRAGFDLVLELPAIFACNNSEFFAKGAVGILSRLGVLTHLSFGSESGNVEELKEIAALLNKKNEDLSHMIKNFSKEGLSFFDARTNAIKSLLGEEKAKLLLNSNNILAIEYLKELNTINSSIMPHTVKRKGNPFNSIDLKQGSSYISASSIRESLKATPNSLENLKAFVPEYTLQALDRLDIEKIKSIDRQFFTVLSSIVLSNPSVLPDIFAITEGLENKVIASIKKTDNLEDLKEMLYSKRYAKSRINRILSQILLGITKNDINAVIHKDFFYARILGFKSSSAILLREIKKNKADEFPLITNLSKGINSPALKNNPILNIDIKSGNFFALLNSQAIYPSSDLVHSPVIY